MPKASLTKDYAIRLRCPHGDEDTRMILEKRSETLEQVLAMEWDFECPVHGLQRQLPLEGNARETSSDSVAASASAPHPGSQTTQRSSPRASLRVPVVAYGWVKSRGSFHEESTTLVVNDTGGLLPLNTRVEVGEMLFLMNKATHAEQECRVAYVERGIEGKGRVGVAFRRKAPAFWQVHRSQPRLRKSLKVWVRGVDPDGNPFAQSAYTMDVSPSGARLKGPGCLTRPGDVIEVKYGWRKARFRIVWTGQAGTPQADEAGIQSLEGNRNIWGLAGRTGNPSALSQLLPHENRRALP